MDGIILENVHVEGFVRTRLALQDTDNRTNLKRQHIQGAAASDHTAKIIAVSEVH